MKSFFRSKFSRVCAVIAAVPVLILGCLLILAALDPYDNRIVENVSIGGLPVGGMTWLEAHGALTEAEEATLSGMGLTVELPKGTLLLSPSATHIRLDTVKAVNEAYRYGRTGDSQAADSGVYSIGLAPYLTFDEVYVEGMLKNYALQYDTVLTEPRHQLEGAMPELSTISHDEAAPCQTLLVTKGLPTQKLDVEAAMAQITAVYDRAFAAADAGEYRVRIEVPATEHPQAPDLDALYAQYCREAVDDALDLQNFQLVPGSYGYQFDYESARSRLAQAEWGETVAIPMEYVAPEIVGEEVYFRDVLGSCETRHSDNQNRNTNLRLLCQLLDGYVVQPGEEFSYNAAVGERTPERGFKPAPAYSGNRLVNDYGGGVCQGSTTLYNCVLLADLEVTARVCHGASVGYVPNGLDAAVNWATKTDLCFRNNSHFPIKIQAEVSDGYVRMRILGTDEKDYYIKMETGSGEDDVAIYSASYKCKYSRETGELISRDLEARSTYYKALD